MKLLKRLFFKQVNRLTASWHGKKTFSSQDSKHTHSVETALKVINDIHLNTDSGKISVSVLLDLNAAFNTVNHNIWLNR